MTRLARSTSNLWLHRFDTPEEIRTLIDASNGSDEHHLIRMPSGIPCAWPGLWICEERPAQGQHTFPANTPLPQVDGQDVTWRLIQAL